MRRDLLRAGVLAIRDLGLADEQLLAARGRGQARRIERPDQIDAAFDAGHAWGTGRAERLLRRERRHQLVARSARALDESDRDFMSPGLDLQRNVHETLHDLFARRRAAAVDEREVFLAANVAAPLLVAVDQHDERMPRLERARIEPRAEIRDREPVLAVGRKRVSRLHAAARAERHPCDIARLGRTLGFGKNAVATLGFGSPTARCATALAASTYCSTNDGETLSAAAMFVKPFTSISGGKYSAGSMSTSSKSFTAFAYSVRLSRCAGT